MTTGRQDEDKSDNKSSADQSGELEASDRWEVSSDVAVGATETEPKVTSKEAAGLADNDEIVDGTSAAAMVHPERESITVGDLLHDHDEALQAAHQRQQEDTAPALATVRSAESHSTATHSNNSDNQRSLDPPARELKENYGTIVPGTFAQTEKAADGEDDDDMAQSLRVPDLQQYVGQQLAATAANPVPTIPESMTNEDLIRLVFQLKQEIAELRAQQQPIKKRTSFDPNMPTKDSTSTSSHRGPSISSLVAQPGILTNPKDVYQGSSTTFDDSYLHGSAMNWSKREIYHPTQFASSQSQGSSSVGAVVENLPPPKRITNEARNVSALSSPPSTGGESKEEEKTEEKEPVLNAHQKKWKSLHSAFLDTADAMHDHEGEDDDSTEKMKKKRGFSKKSSLVFMHPEEVKEMRPYSPEELKKVKRRPFPSRFFITNIQVDWNTVWLRTRHTDHHAHKSSFIQIRDAFKADAITNNPTAAKYALTELLNMCYGMQESEYYSFACTVASAFSVSASNTEFEMSLLQHAPDQARIDHLRRTEANIRNNTIHRDLTEKEITRKALEHEQELARTRIRQLLHIVFSKLQQKKILVDEQKNNIYRLVLCMTKYNEHRRLPYVYASFSFFFQMCAGLYVALSLTKLDEDENTEERWYDSPMLVGRNLALALGTLLYGIMVATPEVLSTQEVFRCLYRSKKSWLALMDFFVNIVLPICVAVCGFFVVLSGETFLDGVLNSVALIFIAEIDDNLPRLLELDTIDIVQGFLIDQAIEEYDELLYSLEYEDVLTDKTKHIQSIEFSDMFLTNTEESGSIAAKGVTFQPYEVFGAPTEGQQPEPSVLGSTISLPESMRSRKRSRHQGSAGQQVANKRSVTADCLLRKVEWQYTKGFNDTCQPRIGLLRLTKLNDRKNPIEIRGKSKAADDDPDKPFFSVTGVFIITCFSMSDDVLRLRICGSQRIEGFVSAFDYYSLWPLDHHARDLLRSIEINHTDAEWRNNERVLNGCVDTPALRPTRPDAPTAFVPGSQPDAQPAVPDPATEPTLIVTNGSASPKTVKTFSTETQESALTAKDASHLNAADEEEIDTSAPAAHEIALEEVEEEEIVFTAESTEEEATSPSLAK